MSYILGVDVSKWQPSVDWALLKSKGVEFAIVKATQGDYTTDEMFEKHTRGAADAEILVGAYHWCDPLVKYTKQAQRFLDVVKDSPATVFCADVEQFWADWAEWAAGKITKFLAPSAISENARNTLAYWDDRTDRKVVLYSRASFVQSFAAPMTAWAGYYPLWMAHYPYANGRVTVSWEEFKEKFLPKLSAPAMPKNCKTWHIWQFTGDKFLLDGMFGDAAGKKLSPADVNFWNGDLASLRAFFGASVSMETPPPVATPRTIEERVSALEGQARINGWKI